MRGILNPDFSSGGINNLDPYTNVNNQGPAAVGAAGKPTAES